MSRIGNRTIAVPQGVEITLDGRHVTVKGPLGSLNIEIAQGIRVDREDGTLNVRRSTDERSQRALHGLTRALLNNMVQGVSGGFQKVLELSGVGYRAQKTGDGIRLTVGFSHPVDVTPPSGITLDVEGTNRIIVRGIDRQVVGQTAANIRAIRPPEPYKLKGIQYQGERLRRKAGKAGAKR